MQHVTKMFLLVGLFGLSTGCTLKNAKIPSAAGIALAEADYLILGEISSTNCGSYILGINWETLFHQETTTTSSGGGLASSATPSATGGSGGSGRYPNAMRNVNTHARGPL